ncbi:Glutamyl-tRNA reductase [Hyphomicrobiales bacterium]|nr:Glutamyl-tRNA reductase [Hyphomicrobiales bacterium]CAH1700180.1 Glutamyl-tRNA reductase [Hyphomicrobiales bacterium]CAI0343942.1 Glutamyl-tRNA reductase [Hyphomicrobiales bacterium]
MTITLIADVLVASLLVATIITCFVLTKRIERLKADEAGMRQTVGALITATDNAERAIAGLKSTLGDCDRTLDERLRTAERYAADLAAQVDAGQAVMERIGQIVSAASLVGAKAAPQAAAVADVAPVSRLETAAQSAAAIRARAARRLEEQAA